jgi:hypothetical protein
MHRASGKHCSCGGGDAVGIEEADQLHPPSLVTKARPELGTTTVQIEALGQDRTIGPAGGGYELFVSLG